MLLISFPRTLLGGSNLTPVRVQLPTMLLKAQMPAALLTTEAHAALAQGTDSTKVCQLGAQGSNSFPDQTIRRTISRCQILPDHLRSILSFSHKPHPP